MQRDQVLLQKVESIAAEHLSAITEKYSKEQYMDYAETYLQPQFKNICDKAKSSGIINVDFTNSGIHYKRPGGVPQLQILSQDEKTRSDIWKKLVLIADENLHFAKVLQSYDKERKIHIAIGNEEKKGYINISYAMAEKLKKWITKDLVDFSENEKDKIETSCLRLKHDLGDADIEKIRVQLQSAINDEGRFPDSFTTLKSLLLSLHLTLYRLEPNKPYHCLYSKITDGKYNLGSFAGSFEEDITDKVRNIQVFSRGLLSYITYWEGIADYDKYKTKLIGTDATDPTIKTEVKTMFEKYFHKDLIFLDPKKIIEDSLSFENTFQSERTSHKTGKKQTILVIRLSVKSQGAFRFLYCDGAANYTRIEKYLETIIKQKWENFDRVRLDVAIADTIPRLDTLYTNTTQPLKIEDAVIREKITSNSIIYKFYNKYRGLLS